MKKQFNKLLFKNNDFQYFIDTPYIDKISFTSEELKAVSNVKKADNLDLKIEIYELDTMYVCHIILKGQIDLIDDYSNKIVPYNLKIDDYLNAGEKDEDDIDILKDKNGFYDLHSSILALFYQSVPKKINYNFKHVSNDDYEIISEDEYLQRKEMNNKNNPFACLKEEEK